MLTIILPSSPKLEFATIKTADGGIVDNQLISWVPLFILVHSVSELKTI